MKLILTACGVMTCTALAHAQPQYDFIKIDSWNANPLAGEAFAWDVSDSGVVCGEATMDNRIGTPGFIWTQALGKVEIPVIHPKEVSNAGLVVGLAAVYDINTHQAWSPPALPGTYYSPSFGGVNEAGLAVGTISGCSCSDSGGVTNVPYLWDAEGGPRGLPFIIPNARGLSRVNNSGVAIGWLNGWQANEGFVTDLNTGAFTVLTDVLPQGLSPGFARALDINNHGDVLGTCPGNGLVYRYTFIYSPTTGVQVLPLPGAGYQQQLSGYGMNDAGTVVGSITSPIATEFAMVYTPARGIQNLNDASLVAGIPAGYRLRVAMRVSNTGWIVGNGAQGSKNTGWVLVPRGAACDPIDFNHDGLFPDTQDIDDFLSVFSGGPCPTGTCGDIDFNNDGLFPDTADIESLLRVFSGGAC
ncbi:MAG TPA: hypothetical protein VHN77_14990 [Phycisphaerales bacterium]|nr:hypothetical protein [Phycisphaerales bacterium]